MDKLLILKQIKLHYGFKKDIEFAKHLDVDPKLLANWVHRKMFDIEILVSKCDDINAEFIVTGKEPMLKNKSLIKIGNLKELPLIATEALAGTGSGELVIKENDIEARYVVPEFNKADFLIRVKGSSMYPKYSAGDVLACKTIDKTDFIQWNKTYVIDSTQGILVKRIVKGKIENEWVLRSDNEKYQDIEVNKTKDVYGIHMVLGVIRLE